MTGWVDACSGRGRWMTSVPTDAASAGRRCFHHQTPSRVAGTRTSPRDMPPARRDARFLGDIRAVVAAFESGAKPYIVIRSEEARCDPALLDIFSLSPLPFHHCSLKGARLVVRFVPSAEDAVPS